VPVWARVPVREQVRASAPVWAQVPVWEQVRAPLSVRLAMPPRLLMYRCWSYCWIRSRSWQRPR